jgi:hypothetical protein
MVDPITQADFASGCRAVTIAPTTTVGTHRHGRISKQRKAKTKAGGWNVRQSIPTTTLLSAFYQDPTGTGTDTRDNEKFIGRGPGSVNQPASPTHFSQPAVVQEQSSEHEQCTGNLQKEICASTDPKDLEDIGSMGLLTALPARPLASEMSSMLNAANDPPAAKQIATTTGSHPRIRDCSNPWAAAAVDGRLLFIAQWTVPHSTDVLRTYCWSTLEAIKVFDGTQYNPSYSDERYDYYHVALDKAECLFPEPTLSKAIRRSSLYRQELEQWKSSASCSMFRTSSCIIGLGRGPNFLATCILQATVCHSVYARRI